MLARLLDDAVRMDRVAKGNIQVFDPRSKSLKIVSQLGFNEDFLRHFESVLPFDPSACGRAFGSGGCVVIADVEHDEGFKPHRAIARASGFRSVKSIPLKGGDGRLLGVLSTHSVDARRDWKRENTNGIAAEIAAILEASPQLAQAPERR